MVTAKILANPAVPLDLPKASSSEEVQVVYSVQITEAGRIFANGAAIATDEEMLSLSRAALARDRELRAVIQADGRVPHRVVVHAMDLLRKAGIGRIAFAALPEDEAQ